MNDVAVPCAACPWRTSNQGKRHPDGWYTKANLARLWAKLRDGESMSCHPTDPANPVSERAQEAGYRPAPAHSQTRECAGALVLQQREMQVLQDMGVDLKAYRRRRPRGLTKRGMAVIVERMMLGGVLAQKLPRVNLNEPDIGHAPLPWPPKEDSGAEHQ